MVPGYVYGAVSGEQISIWHRTKVNHILLPGVIVVVCRAQLLDV